MENNAVHNKILPIMVAWYSTGSKEAAYLYRTVCEKISGTKSSDGARQHASFFLLYRIVPRIFGIYAQRAHASRLAGYMLAKKMR
jgi:hypothetical protein